MTSNKTLEQTSNDDGEIEQIRKQTWFDCRKRRKNAARTNGRITPESLHTKIM
jgi:DUF4097 and DUF4098 domain-containing protein YvlB